MDIGELINILKQVSPDIEIMFGYPEGNSDSYSLIEIGGVKEIEIIATGKKVVVLTPDDDQPNIHLN